MHEPSMLQRLLRERTLGRYVAALEDGDLDTVAAIMQRAQRDGGVGADDL